MKTACEPFSATVEKGKTASVETRIDLPEKLPAPIAEGEKLGTVTYLCGGKELGTADILAADVFIGSTISFR